MNEPVLRLTDVAVEIPTRAGSVRPVDGVSFEIAPGETLGVVGESGAGKSMIGNAIAGLLSAPARIAAGQVALAGARIDDLPAEDIRRLRGKEIGMVFQEPLTALNPLLTVGEQLVETIQTHLGLPRREAEARAVAALEEVGIPAAARRVNAYPHAFSGGMRQRVVIALALCAEPRLVIADEPTTALDVSVQAQIVALLKRLSRERGVAVMLVTHDMGVIAEAADRVAVMYAGRLAEIGPVRQVLGTPRHPYTAGLIAATPQAGAGHGRLHQIPGAMPRPGSAPVGCAFHPRCDRSSGLCRAAPRPDLALDPEGRAACHHPVVAPLAVEA